MSDHSCKYSFGHYRFGQPDHVGRYRPPSSARAWPSETKVLSMSVTRPSVGAKKEPGQLLGSQAGRLVCKGGAHSLRLLW